MKSWKLAAVALLGLAPTAFADAPPNYVSVMGSYVIEDKARAGDHGLGWHILYGSPMNNWLGLELGAFGTRLDRTGSDVYDYQYGFGLDLLGTRDFSPMFSGFALGGLGSVFEDFPGSEQLSPYVDIGAGVLVATPVKNLKVRGEGRYYAMFNARTYPDKDVEYDAHLNLGVQFAFGELLAPKQALVGDADHDGVPDNADRCPDTPVGTPVGPDGCPIVGDDDGDGVPNDRDACPLTPPGTLVDARGCPAAVPLAPIDADADGDGVVDSIDQCPNTRPGAVVDAQGCPLDEDGDGVLNANDLCPHTPFGLKVDEHGCAEKGSSTIILRSVHFDFDQATLTREARTILDGVVEGMKGQPTMKVELAGHCDALGTESYNLNLSQRRADAVRNYLIDRGIEGGRMHAEGYGEFQPIADNETEEGRAQNRRVEFKVLER